MKNSFSSKLAATALLAGALILSLNTANAASRKDHTRTRTGTYQTSKGNSGTFSQTTTREQGQKQRTATVTNQDGKTTSHESTRTWDRATGTGTTSSSTTLPNGKTTSREGPITKTGDKIFESQGTATGPNGRTGNYDIVTTRTENGRTSSGTITGPGGKQATITKSTEHIAPGEKERTTTITGPNRKSQERVIATKVSPDGSGTRTVEITKPDGTTETRTQTFTVNPTTPAP
ncbi:MAG: hypothetical protein IPP19_12320 [Verrucomicrobia bacterium]|nr:hypothetical protein [Verrucomicrobiota bacterium]